MHTDVGNPQKPLNLKSEELLKGMPLGVKISNLETMSTCETQSMWKTSALRLPQTNLRFVQRTIRPWPCCIGCMHGRKCAAKHAGDSAKWPIVWLAIGVIGGGWGWGAMMMGVKILNRLQ